MTTMFGRAGSAPEAIEPRDSEMRIVSTVRIEALDATLRAGASSHASGAPVTMSGTCPTNRGEPHGDLRVVDPVYGAGGEEHPGHAATRDGVSRSGTTGRRDGPRGVLDDGRLRRTAHI